MSLGNDKNNFTLSSGMTNQEIKSSLISIYDKINKPSTKEVGYDLYLKLVHKNLYSPSQINFIINHVGEFINPLSPKEKDPCLKLLSLIFYSPSNEDDSFDTTIYYPYLSPVLSILQNLIKDTNSTIFPTISNIFAEIIQNIMPTDIEASNVDLDQDEKTAYEMLQGFCIYNMKYDDKSNRIVGSLCLTKLVENCPIVLQRQYMKLIWEVIINLIDKKNFNAKYELLNCLISLILGAENLFTPYAHNTLYKVLDFLADTDWLKRKLALNVIYTLIFYCKEEIMPLKEHIISFLRALKTDKVKEVREVCLLILKIFSENEQKTKETKNKINTNANSGNTKKKIGSKSIESKTKIKKPVNTKEGAPIKKNVNQNKSSKNLESEKKNVNNFNNKFSECVVPESQDKNKKENKDNKDIKEIEDININISEENTNQTNNKKRFSSGSGGGINPIEDPESNYINNSLKKGKQSSTTKNLMENRIFNKENTGDICTLNQPKFVNRKDDKTFINEKMVIKPDPNKSIFKSNPNPAFFNQANAKSKDIVLVSKGEPRRNSNNNNLPKKVDKIVENENNEELEIKSPKIEDKKNNDIKDSDKKDINKKISANKNTKKNKDEEPKEKENEKDQLDDNDNNIKIEEENNANNNIIKEKVEVPVNKGKAGPIVRNKKLKRNQESEQNNEEKEERKKINENSTKLNTYYKRNNVNKKVDNDDELEDYNDYKNYLNKNEIIPNKKVNKEKVENETHDPNIINTLLSQMNSLSEKQLYLIDIMDNIQMETQGQIKELNKRIAKLEKNMEEFNNELDDIKNDN